MSNLILPPQMSNLMYAPAKSKENVINLSEISELSSENTPKLSDINKIIVDEPKNNYINIGLPNNLSSIQDINDILKINNEPKKTQEIYSKVKIEKPFGKNSICLNMIVKNESRIITRLLTSVLPIIDTYCICDTGSTDNTIEVITKFMEEHNIPGFIFTEPFRDFGYNRTVALEKARGMADYLLLLDADMILKIGSKFQKENLSHGAYQVLQKNSSIQYTNVRLIHSRIAAKCMGVTHEYYDLPNCNTGRLEDDELIINDIGDGGAKGDKYTRDIRLLEQGLLDNPSHGLKQRYHFYLANTYLDNKVFDKAIDNYKKRIELGGWVEECWYSRYRIGIAYMDKGQPEMAINWWLEAFNFHSKRAESLYEVIKYYRLQGKNRLAYEFYLMAKRIPFPKDDILFVDYRVYDRLLDYEASIILYYIQNHDIKVDNLISQLFHKDMSEYYSNLLSNYKFYYTKLNNLNIGKVINYNNETIMNIGNHPHKMITSTPSVFQLPNGEIWMNIRLVNYRINQANGGYSYDKNKIITANRLVKLDPSNNYQMVESYDIEPEYIDADQYQGIEDCKVHVNPFTGQTRFVGTIFYNNLTIGYGEYPINNVEQMRANQELGKPMDKLIYHPCISPENSRCEKNWCLVGDQVIYKWHPFTVGKLIEKPKIGVFEANNLNSMEYHLEIKEKKQMPWFFQHVRGSTNGYWEEKTRQWWFVCHIVEYGNPRMYYDLLVVLDENLNLVKYSKPFKFTEDKIEYCLGLIVQETAILMSYSTWDSTANLAIYNREKLEKEIFC